MMRLHSQSAVRNRCQVNILVWSTSSWSLFTSASFLKEAHVALLLTTELDDVALTHIVSRAAGLSRHLSRVAQRGAQGINLTIAPIAQQRVIRRFKTTPPCPWDFGLATVGKSPSGLGLRTEGQGFGMDCRTSCPFLGPRQNALASEPPRRRLHDFHPPARPRQVPPKIVPTHHSEARRSRAQICSSLSPVPKKQERLVECQWSGGVLADRAMRFPGRSG